MDPAEAAMVWKLRAVLHALEPAAAIELLINKVRETKSNAEFLVRHPEELALTLSFAVRSSQLQAPRGAVTEPGRPGHSRARAPPGSR